MCGIVGGVAQRDVTPILLEGLRRLEYRGYDSAGLAVINDQGLVRHRRLGKVIELENAINEAPITGGTGIAHTRWATHGEPSESNAHPHVSYDKVAIVHNGIIENYEVLKGEQESTGMIHTSETDTEVAAHHIAGYYEEETKSLYVISDDNQLDDEEKLTHAHEYTHALQDQYFSLADIQNGTLNSDETMALRALAEGEAS